VICFNILFAIKKILYVPVYTVCIFLVIDVLYYYMCMDTIALYNAICGGCPLHYKFSLVVCSHSAGHIHFFITHKKVMVKEGHTPEGA